MQNTTNINHLHGLDAEQLWNTELAFQHLEQLGIAESKRTVERRINELGLLAPLLEADTLVDAKGQKLNELLVNHAINQAKKKRQRLLFIQLTQLPNGKTCLQANDARNAQYWIPLANQEDASLMAALAHLQQHLDKPIHVLGHGAITSWLAKLNNTSNIATHSYIYPIELKHALAQQLQGRVKSQLSPHIKKLEAESIHIIREAVAESENPVMLYSIGKDSGVMLHLARKAFYPSRPPFPLLHVDTRWKFQEMYQFRDYMAQTSGMELLIHTNPEAIEKNINPFEHGSALHTDITKTEGLKQALDKYKFDVIFGGARRDEEKSRAKERVFSFRTPSHRWDPKNQRPELWQLYNTRKKADESIRVFPLSNWTELDIWQYIYHENIPMVPLYFAKERPVVVRDDMIMLVDDARCQLHPDEDIELKKIRFRTLGCYPLTGAIESNADTLDDIILEIVQAHQSERQGRKIDSDSAGSMEKKKQEGYF